MFIIDNDVALTYYYILYFRMLQARHLVVLLSDNWALKRLVLNTREWRWRHFDWPPSTIGLAAVPLLPIVSLGRDSIAQVKKIILFHACWIYTYFKTYGHYSRRPPSLKWLMWMSKKVKCKMFEIVDVKILYLKNRWRQKPMLLYQNECVTWRNY